MKRRILILEDNDERREAMAEILSDRLSMYDLFLTDDPEEFLSILGNQADRVLAVSLDHDLHERADRSTRVTGMDVVDGLVPRTPSFPVLLHTTNTVDGERMRETLTVRGWDVTWIKPFDGVSWVITDWYPALKRVIRNAARRESVPAADEAE